jgi:hypothetical protein
MPTPLITRSEAKVLRQSKYFTGNPCPKGHIAERRVHNATCVECDRAHSTKSAHKWYFNNKTVQHEKSRIWLQQHPEVRREIERRYYQNHLSARLSKRLRTRLWAAVNGKYSKKWSAVSELGCDIEYLIAYLESHFLPGMVWENYGITWEIDHQKPLMSFDLSDQKQFQEACHYTNLQPLFCGDHYKKTQGDRQIYGVK